MTTPSWPYSCWPILGEPGGVLGSLGEFWGVWGAGRSCGDWGEAGRGGGGGEAGQGRTGQADKHLKPVPRMLGEGKAGFLQALVVVTDSKNVIIFKRYMKNPTYRRHQISQPMQIVAPLLFSRWR